MGGYNGKDTKLNGKDTRNNLMGKTPEILYLVKYFNTLSSSVKQLLIAVPIFSAGYYSASNFLQFKEFELYWDAVFFTIQRI